MLYKHTMQLFVFFITNFAIIKLKIINIFTNEMMFYNIEDGLLPHKRIKIQRILEFSLMKEKTQE